MNDERTGPDVLATIATKLAPLEGVAAGWHDAPEKLSLGQWLHEEGVVLLGCAPEFFRSSNLINQTIIGCLADLILRQHDFPTRRTWIFLDEVSTAGRIGPLPSLMRQGPAKGVCVALAVQQIRDLHGVYGSPGADQLAAACSHMTALQTSDPETAAWAERQFGPPLRAADLMSLPPTGPDHGCTAFHRTPRAGTHLAHRPREWVLANLHSPKTPPPGRDPGGSGFTFSAFSKSDSSPSSTPSWRHEAISLPAAPPPGAGPPLPAAPAPTRATAPEQTKRPPAAGQTAAGKGMAGLGVRARFSLLGMRTGGHRRARCLKASVLAALRALS